MPRTKRGTAQGDVGANAAGGAPGRRPAGGDARRAAALEHLADHLLREGLAGASLRPMAAAAGTSGRMLLYYFADKDEVLAATLRHVAARLARTLERSRVGPAARSPRELFVALWAAVRAPALRPYVRLWLELGARAACGEEPHRAVAGEIADQFLQWTARRLCEEPGRDRTATAALVLAAVDGCALLDAVGRGATADAAATLFLAEAR